MHVPVLGSYVVCAEQRVLPHYAAAGEALVLTHVTQLEHAVAHRLVCQRLAAFGPCCMRLRVVWRRLLQA